MTPAAVLAILVAAGQAQSPDTAAMLAASTEVVAGTGPVRLVDDAPLTDAAALRVERELGTRAVVRLEWRDADRLRAHLRLHAARTDRWIDRDIAFEPADTLPERGRTLGFAIASMLPEGDPALRLAEAAPAPAPQKAAPPGRHAADLSALAGAGLGGPASGFGGALGLETFVADAVSVGLSLTARLGRIDDVDGRALTTSAGLGGTWWPVAPTEERRLGLGLRGEALVLYHTVSHARPGGGVEWKGATVPGAALLLEATWRLSRFAEVAAAGGAEVAFGTIEVSVSPPPVSGGTARIPALRARAQAGFRLRF